jgi:methyl-accepting chemotaxis protein
VLDPVSAMMPQEGAILNLSWILRRRRFIVDSSLQFKLLLYSVGYILFYTAAIGTGLFVPLMIQLSGADQTSPETLAIATSVLYLHYHFWPVALLSIMVVALHSILISHRVAGPLYRFRLIFRDLQEGIIPKAAHLRRKDLLQAEMQSVNEMIESLGARMSEIQKAGELLSQSIAEYKRRAALPDDPGISQCIEELAERGDLLAQATRTIHIMR